MAPTIDWPRALLRGRYMGVVASMETPARLSSSMPRLKNKDLAVNRNIGNRLRYARTMRGLSQSRLAETLGVSFQQIQKYENGTNALAAAKLAALTRYLGVSADFLLGLASDSTEKMLATQGKSLRLLQKIMQLERQRPKAFLSVYHLVEELGERES
jgi:transcriptional regulator with XRE-family HTH domain